MEQDTNNAIYNIASNYVNNGLSILPIKTDGSKRPHAKLLPNYSWNGLTTVKPTAYQLENWFDKNKSGIGIIAGKVSGNLEIIDFDHIHKYEDFCEALTANDRTDIIQKMAIVKTPKNGRHWYYRCSQAVERNRKLAYYLTNDGKYSIAIETRGEKGYTLAPGSPAECHSKNLPYEFIQNDFSNIPVLTIEDQNLILNTAISLNEKPDHVEAVCTDIYAFDKGATSGNVDNRPGDLYNQSDAWKELLLRHDWTYLDGKKDENWKRPDKAEASNSATWYADTRCFRIWSSNCLPLQADTSYSPFALYAVLECDGDFSEAASQLAAEGYVIEESRDTSSGPTGGVKGVFDDVDHNDCSLDTSNNGNSKRQTESRGKRLLDMTDHHKVDYFVDLDGTEYMVVGNACKKTNYIIESKEFKNYLRGLWEQNSKDPTIKVEDIKTVQEVLKARASNSKNVFEVHTRIAQHSGNVYINLANDKHDFVEITKNGWSII